MAGPCTGSTIDVRSQVSYTQRVMNRRAFCASLLAPLWAAAPAMKVTRVETIYWKTREAAPWWPHWIWVRVHTDSGLTGI